jgi:hypothetical protein
VKSELLLDQTQVIDGRRDDIDPQQRVLHGEGVADPVEGKVMIKYRAFGMDFDSDHA